MSDYYILENGEPKQVDDLLQWGRWLEENRMTRHIGDDEINGVRVSTVFLGLDHSHGFGPPLIFETMVFGGSMDGEQDRYSTTQQAIDGHTAMCARVRDATRPDRRCAMNDAAVQDQSDAEVAPPKRWFNWWLALESFRLVNRSGQSGDITAGNHVQDLTPYPSKEIAEQRADDDVNLRGLTDVVRYEGAFPEGKRP